ncbi:MAG: PASTA domain-containing protein [Actinobacteria bacterium]|nr:PASTA domain-containing protein [Actinomycetota bacterium]
MRGVSSTHTLNRLTAQWPRPSKRSLAAILCAGFLVVTVASCSYTTKVDLPKTQPETSRILWGDGTTMANLHAEQDREEISFEKMGDFLPVAVVAIEDSRYFEHDGVDPRGILRALTRDLKSGKVIEGGSTITQQYVRAVLLTPEQTFTRKIKEAVLAVQLERQYSKQAILKKYLNLIYFGNGAYGVQAAARTYFGKDAIALNLTESALLAGLIRSPGDYDPFTQPDAALARRNEVLSRIEVLKRLPAEDKASAIAAPLGVGAAPATQRTAAPHFVERVRAFILSDPTFGETAAERERLLYQGGLRIETTLDPRAQAQAVDAVTKTLSSPATDPAAAVVSIDPRNGHILAYVGGSDFYGDEPWARYDLAGQGKRSAGSSFKPFVLAAALEAGVSLEKQYPAPGELTIPIKGQAPWLIRNYDGKGGGTMNLIEATVHSVNTVYAELITEIGAQPVVDLANKLGVESKLGAYPSSALGSNGVTVLDMASAYSSFADDGMHTSPVFITQVSTNTGEVLWRARPSRERTLPVAISRNVTQVLQQVVERGTAVNARIGRSVAGKTGTGEEWSDAWFVGYTPELVTAVWVGFPDAARTMRPPTTRITVTGGTWPAQIWQATAGAYLAETPASKFPTPIASVTGASGATGPRGPTGPGLTSVVGQSTVDATRILVDAGYRVRLYETASRSVAAGFVISQSPAAGAPFAIGGTITLAVSTGPPLVVPVPSVLGLSAQKAAALLGASGFEVQIHIEAEPPPGAPERAASVWKQLPAGGEPLAVDQAVTIWLNP